MIAGHHSSRFLELLILLEKAIARRAALLGFNCPVERPFGPWLVGSARASQQPRRRTTSVTFTPVSLCSATKAPARLAYNPSDTATIATS